MNAIVDPQKSTTKAVTRVPNLKKAVQAEEYAACIERAMLWTQFSKNKNNKAKSRPVFIAEATRHVLRNKTVEIYPEELVVGNFTAHRVGGIIYPEMTGIAPMMEIFKIPTRRVNPLNIKFLDRIKLALTIPYWLTRNTAVLAFDNNEDRARFAKEQGEALQYQLYEAGGIAHLAPGYEKIIRLGAEGIIAEVEAFEAQTTDPEKLEFYRGVKISMEALGEFGDRYAAEATRVASDERDPVRRQELEKIAEVCTRVPRHGASSFYEAVQCMTLVHIAIRSFKNNIKLLSQALRREVKYECNY